MSDSDPQDIAEELDEDVVGEDPEEEFLADKPVGIDATGAPREGEAQYEPELSEDDDEFDEDDPDE